MPFQNTQTTSLSLPSCLLPIACAVLLLMHFQAQANTEYTQTAPVSGAEAELATQTVTSSRLMQNRSELAATVQIIDSAELQTQIQGGLNLKEALGHLVPGIDLGGQGRSSFGQNLRGRPMLVMIDQHHHQNGRRCAHSIQQRSGADQRL